MIDVQALDRTGRRQVLHGLLAQYNLGSESAKVALGMAHQNLPGFTALMERNVRLMRPGAAMEKTLQAVLARPAKPSSTGLHRKSTTTQSAALDWTS